MYSVDELTDIVIIPYLEHETDTIRIPDNALVGTSILMYSDFNDEVEAYDDSDGRISETRNLIIYAIDKHIKTLFERNNLNALINYTHLTAEFLNDWNRNSGWKTIIDGNTSNHESQLIVIAMDVLLKEGEWK